jgi:hypothetical protein
MWVDCRRQWKFKCHAAMVTGRPTSLTELQGATRNGTMILWCRLRPAQVGVHCFSKKSARMSKYAVIVWPVRAALRVPDLRDAQISARWRPSVR